MKKRIIICIALLSIILFSFNACNSSEEEQLKINNEVFETVYGEWIPYGDARFDGEYYLYEKDSKIIFAENKDNRFSESLIYHNTSDAYPDISMTDRIDKIVFQTNREKIELSDDMKAAFSNEILNSDKSNGKIATADLATMEIFVFVYYKDYPAFQNEIALCCSDSGDVGYVYCETQKNTNKFGFGNMSVFSDEQLISYIESLGLFSN